MTVIHTYCYGDGGFGDFIRSVFAYYVYCKIHNIEFYWYIENHPFQSFFENDNISLENSELFFNVGSYNKSTQDFLELIKTNKDKKYIVRSNVFNFIDFETLKEYRESFRNYLLNKIKKDLKDRIDFLRPSEDFSCVHLRCGDYFMPIINIQSDMRIDFSKLENKIKKLEGNHVIFSDSSQIKNFIKKIRSEWTILDTHIHHTAVNGPYNGHLDSIAEFFIMGLSKKIIVFSNSGFSFWSSFIFDVPLFNDDNTPFTNLNF